ncbi:BREX system P-loop protein BrxC [Idiomarina sp.]|uniref:BREX system P-loop protein BrxC n=1 Tax=Idiomarina sp. TaxID=1874361 RepID=UPI003A8D42C9
MNIEQIFTKKLTRNINGVVKAEQKDEESVFVELDEYVVTQELNRHITEFFDSYTPEAGGKPNEAARGGKVAVWISGFFGSGKSHLLKILGYLLENRKVAKDGAEREAIEFFREKISDALLLGNIQRAVAQDTDVILFNIDSRANTEDRDDAILKVFLRVFNERVGYCAEYPFIAHLERELDKRGQYQKFKDKFNQLTGSSWEKERDAFDFYRDDMAEALAFASEQTLEATVKWVDGLEKNFPLDIRNFCRWINEYSEANNNRNVLFMVDEVGQFIGKNSKMMLKLQTIAEDLGTYCGGRAWLVVTAQADIDKAIGHLDKIQGQDFSKIQGRFATRMQLSSTNTSEVIQKRLLEKTPEARAALEKEFAEKGDILRNQLTFDETTTAALKRYEDAESFVINYPFVPYHYELVQKVFEAIRTKGATGKHLAMGERSLLDAFQHAAKQIKDQKLDVLVPFYSFYAPIESFLEPAVKRTIEQAVNNSALTEFDGKVLKVLFLIRYVDVVKSTLDNLVTLCIDQIDADKINLRKAIEESLNRLERQVLIARNGDEFVFLTNEEKEIENEIRHTDIEGAEVTNKLSEIIFDEVLRRQNKYRYPENKQDFPIARYCNGHPRDGSLQADLILKIISPLDLNYEQFSHDQACRTASNNDGAILMKLPAHDRIYDELRTFIQTARFISLTGGQRPEQEHLLRDKQLENSQRGKRLVSEFEQLFKDAEVFAIGEKLQIKASSPQSIVEEAYKYVIENSFSKLRMLKLTPGDVLHELRAVLTSDDTTQDALDLDGEAVNAEAIKEIEQFLAIKYDRNEKVFLTDIETRFTRRPYGWPTNEILLIVARLGLAGRITLTREAPLLLRNAYEPMTSVRQRAEVQVMRVRQHNEAQIRKAVALAKQVFNRSFTGTQEKELANFICENLLKYQRELSKFKSKSETGKFPGKDLIENSLTVVNEVLGNDNPYAVVESFVEQQSSLLDLVEDFEDLDDFYTAQFHTWQNLTKALMHDFQVNDTNLRRDTKAAEALEKLERIYDMPQPYGHLSQVQPLIETVRSINDALVAAQRDVANSAVEACLERIQKELDSVQADGQFKNKVLRPLQLSKQRIGNSHSIPDLIAAVSELPDQEELAYDAINELIEQRAQRQKEAAQKEEAQEAEQRSKQSEAENETGGVHEPIPKPEPKPAPQPVVKKIVTVQPGKEVPTAQFLESEADVKAYLQALEEKLLTEVRNGNRVRLK